MDWRAWRATVHGVVKSQTQVSDNKIYFCMEIDEIREYVDSVLTTAVVSCAQQPCRVDYFFHLIEKETYDLVTVAQLVSGRSGSNIQIF